MDNKDLMRILGFQNRESVILSSILYPVDLAKIQVNISQNPQCTITNVWTNLKQTYTTFGFQGCYTGVIPWIATTASYKYAFMGTQKLLSRIEEKIDDDDDEEINEYVRFRRFMRILGKGILCKTVAVVVSHPYYVVTVRTVAQLASQETKYTDLFSAIWRIIQEEGIKGLFVGLWPRLLADLTVYSTVTTTIYILHRTLDLDLNTRDLIDMVIKSVGVFWWSSLHAISSRMAINNCGLTAGSPPNMPHYRNAFHCWKHLNSLSISSKVIEKSLHL